MVPQIKLKVHGLIQDAEWRQPILEEPSAGFHKEPSGGLHKEPSAGLQSLQRVSIKSLQRGSIKSQRVSKEPSAGFIGSVWWVCQ